ncbi:Subtilisin-like protease SDD1 [Morella rubra]|uniref:Subtilisin-like protease SDD1 n=1 Tax=Morella rubra TaxID=262757 RepID=A0A6A1WLF2_9ROSI|nr:Subtilisin-like protease SDD1 [Morella rubra]
MAYVRKATLENRYSSIRRSFYDFVGAFGHYISTIESLKFDIVLHGCTAVLTLDELEVLKKSSGFISAYSDTASTLATTYTPKFLSLSASVGLLNASNYGKDIIIGIVDTGVWPESPSFNDNGFPGKPLIYENAIAATSFSAIEKGIVVVTATGNQGPTLKTVDNGFPWVLTVASSTIDRWFAGSLALGNGETIYGWSMFPSDTLCPNLPLMYNRLTTLSCTSNKLYGVSNGVLSTIKLNMLSY